MKFPPCLLSLCLLPVATAKRAGGLPFTRSISRQAGSLKQPQQAPTQDSLPPRGGGAVKAKPLYTPGRVPIELNPNYVPPPWRSASETAAPVVSQPEYAPLDDTTLTYPSSQSSIQDKSMESISSDSLPTVSGMEYRAGSVVWGKTSQSASWLDTAKSQYLALYRTSPALTTIMVSCVAIFLAWQIQPRSTLLHRYFVVSRANMQASRWPSTLLSSVSHIDFWHLLVNLYGLWSFGPVVQRILGQNGQSILPFLGGAALTSSLTFLYLQNYSGAGGALGLSGVTLALLAVYARTFPNQVLGMRLAGVIPVRMKAENFLKCLTIWSFLGSFARVQSNVAHASHLGGLLFGVVYNELFLRQARQPKAFFHM